MTKAASPFGKALRKLRIEHGESGTDLGFALGVTPAAISAIELGKQPVPPALLKKIISHYELRPKEKRELYEAATLQGDWYRFKVADLDVESRKLFCTFCSRLPHLDKKKKKQIASLLA